jgi:hypothetical protein
MGKEEQRLIGLFRAARDFHPSRFDDYEELMAFYEGDQDELTMFKNEKPWVVSMNTPYSSLAIDTRVASLQASDYMGKISPLSPEDVDNIYKLEQLYKNEWQIMQMDDKISDAIHRSAVVREAYIHVIYNPDKIKGGTNRLQKGALEAYFLDPGSVLIDPRALDMKNADYIIVTERLTPFQAKEMYGITKDEESVDHVFSPYERGEVYLGNDYDTEQGDVLTKMTFYEKSESGIVKSCMVDGKIVTEKTELEIPVYPIAQLRWEKRAESPYGISLMDRLLPEQKAINSIESAVVNSALAFVAPQFVVRKDSGLDPKLVAKYNGAPGVVYVSNGDPTNAIVPLVAPKIDPQIIEIKREYEITIDKIASRTAEFLGNFGTSGNTAQGTANSIARSTIIEQKFLRNMETFVQDLTEIIIHYIVKAYKGKTIYTRSEQMASGQFNFGEIEVLPELEDLEYSFSLDLEVKTQYSKERERQLMLELFQFERQYDAPVKAITVKDILKVYDVSNREELVDRYDKLVTQDEMTKAQLIQEFVEIAKQLQELDPQVITQGIQEIMAGGETPTVDQILAEVEAQQQEMEQGMEQIQQQEMEQTGQMLETQQEIEQMVSEAQMRTGAMPDTGGMPMAPEQQMAPEGEMSPEEMAQLEAMMGQMQ